MENKQVGYLLLGVAILLIVITFLFNSALMESVRTSCFIDHGDVESCEMFDSVDYQKYFALSIVGILIVISGVLIFTKPKEKIIVKIVKEKKKRLDKSLLDKKEKKAIELIESENGTIFQADLMEKMGIGKVGITRLLDKLEAKQIVERKRRGMNNVVVLKN